MQETTINTLKALSGAFIKTLESGTCNPSQAQKLIECLSLEPFGQAALDFITFSGDGITSPPGTIDILDKQTLPRLFARALSKNDLSSAARINIATTWEVMEKPPLSRACDANFKITSTAC